MGFILDSYVTELYLLILSFLLYKLISLKKRKLLWEKLNVKYDKPVPFLGNDLDVLVGIRTTQASQVRRYEKYNKTERFVGYYLLTQPFLFIMDLNLIEKILIKDFTYFYDRGFSINEKLDPLQGHLFFLSGKRWKALRNKLSPTFTSGKLKIMLPQLIDCADMMLQYFEKFENFREPIDIKDVMSKFTMDVIGSCVFGININSLENPDSEFRKMGKRIFTFSLRSKLKQLFRTLFRTFFPAVPIKQTSKDVEDFFLGLVKNTIKIREENKIERNDFLQLLANLRKQGNIKEVNIEDNDRIESMEKLNYDDLQPVDIEIDDNIIAANAFIFFVAGFETTASTISFCLYELSKNVDVQNKLRQAIKDVLKDNNAQLTFDAIRHIPYLDQVISETLRLYPPVPLLFRQCTKDYKIPDSNIVIPKGTRIEIPIYSIHNDSRYYENPKEFNPNRFANSKEESTKALYLPFGDGPRICIGSRFAMMEMKVALCKILCKFNVRRNPKTPEEIEFDPKSPFLLASKTGILIDFQKI